MTPDFTVVNKGNLNAKAKIAITGIDADEKLLEVIDFDIEVCVYGYGSGAEIWGSLANYAPDGEIKLAANQPYTALRIVAKMDEAAGNEYQGLTLDGIGITVLATQDANEADSFGNTYDSEAKLPQILTVRGDGKAIVYSDPATPATLAGETITITFDGESGEKPIGVQVKEGAALTISDCKMTASAVTDLGGGYSSLLIVQNSGSTLVIDGGHYENDSDPASGVVANHVLRVLDNAECVIKGGTFLGSGRDDLIDVNSGATLTIEGGFFNARINPTLGGTTYDQTYSIYVARSAPATVIVKGGTFVNCDPSQVWGVTVPAGYTVISETQSNGDVWYTVVAE